MKNCAWFVKHFEHPNLKNFQFLMALKVCKTFMSPKKPRILSRGTCKNFLIPLALLLVGVLAIILVKVDMVEKKTICFENSCINAEVADSPQERSRGLMYREHLAPSEGLLFVFDNPAEHPFWMKNMLIPLDIIWINEDNQVVGIKTAEPCVQDVCPNFKPESSAKYVLEVNAGFAEEQNIHSGDFLEIN